MTQPVEKVKNAVAWRYRHVRERLYDWRESRIVAKKKLLMPDVEYDVRIKYPCYKSFDDLIDIDQLKSLDGYIKERVEPFLKLPDNPTFHSGSLKLHRNTPSRPGSRLIHLSRAKEDIKYQDLNKPDVWEPSEQAKSFPELMKFIDTLPFQQTARMVIIADDLGRAVTAHRDHPATKLCHEFIWFRSNLDKPFWMYSPKTDEKVYLTSYSAWFDTVNQFHGSDDTGQMAISIRVDGIFTDEFRKQIPKPSCNLASTAALWASLS